MFSNNSKPPTGWVGRWILIGFVISLVTLNLSARDKKYGLFIGINEYRGKLSRLKGAVNDAVGMRQALTGKFGFPAANTTLLTDNNATRANIIKHIKMYEEKVDSGDLLVVHYSGHGTLFPDKFSEDMDETKTIIIKRYFDYGIKTFDSALVPIDSSLDTSGKPWRNLILDDELYEMFGAITSKGAQVIFITDSCYSGTIAKGETKALPRTVPLVKAFQADDLEDLKFCQTGMKEKPPKTEIKKGLYLTLSAAQDDETALDMPEDKQKGLKPMGLFTSKLLVVLNNEKSKGLSYEQLINIVSPQVSKISLKEDNSQTPQIDSRFGDPQKKIFSLN